MTITEKILARAAGCDQVRPGEFITCRLDLVMANDITAPIDAEKVVLVADHITTNKDIK